MLSRDVGVVALALCFATGTACVVTGGLSDPERTGQGGQLPALLGGSGGSDFGVNATFESFHAIAGMTFEYVVFVNNSGPEAGETSLTFEVDPNSTVVAWECSANPGICSEPTVGDDLAGLNSLFLDMPASTGAAIFVTVQIDSDATGTISLTAQSSAEGDDNSANNESTHQHDVAVLRELHVTKSDELETVAGGSTLTYSILVESRGPSDAPAVDVTDDVSALPFVSVEWSCEHSEGAVCGTEGGTGNIDDTGSIPAGESLLYTLTAQLDACFTGTVTNTAVIASTSLDLDSVLTATDTTEVPAVGDECPQECECDCDDDDDHHDNGHNGAGHHDDGNGHGHNDHDDDGDGDDDHKGNGHHRDECDCDCDDDGDDE